MKCLNCGHEFEKIKRKVKIVVGYNCLICNKLYHNYDEAEQCEISHKDLQVAQSEIHSQEKEDLHCLNKQQKGTTNLSSDTQSKVNPSDIQRAEDIHEEIKKEISKDYGKDN